MILLFLNASDILLSILLENSLKLYHHFFLKSFGEKRLAKSVKLLYLSMKSINPIQKYPHITESYACY